MLIRLFVVLAVVLIGLVALAAVGELYLWKTAPADTPTQKPHDGTHTPLLESSQDHNALADLGDGLKLISLASTAGQFPEDGSDSFHMDILSASFRNDSERTIQYAQILLNINGKAYSFRITTLPPKATIRAYEMSKSATPERIETLTAKAEALVYFTEEPSCYEEDLQITIGEKQITVKNISGKDITDKIYIYYKNTVSKVYMGGITYRMGIEGLKAGETVSGYASHAGEDSSKLMFVTYGG